MGVRGKNIYDPPAPEDGWRLLVMRKWPRGISKQAVDEWDKELGPSVPLLEKWRRGQLDWDSFRRSYQVEMRAQEEKRRLLAIKAREGTVSLLCSCKDGNRCHRAILKELIERPDR